MLLEKYLFYWIHFSKTLRFPYQVDFPINMLNDLHSSDSKFCFHRCLRGRIVAFIYWNCGPLFCLNLRVAVSLSWRFSEFEKEIHFITIYICENFKIYKWNDTLTKKAWSSASNWPDFKPARNFVGLNAEMTEAKNKKIAARKKKRLNFILEMFSVLLASTRNCLLIPLIQFVGLFILEFRCDWMT